MNKDINYYLNLPYTTVMVPEPEGGWFVSVKELPGCMIDADTREEALSEIDQLKREWLEIALEDGLEIPEPRPDEEYSGKFNLRVPKSLHRKLVGLAEAEGVSLNTYCTTALAEATGSGFGKHQSNKTPLTTSDWEKAMTSLLDTFELGNREPASIEERFSSWLTEEMSDFLQIYQAGDVKGAVSNIVITEKLLFKFGKASPLVQAISQIFFNMRQVIESENREVTQIPRDQVLDTLVRVINKFNLSRDRLEGARQVEQQPVVKQTSESVVVNQFAQMAQISKFSHRK